tara:strand:- start:770 stop:946 length:177 start_codon:yes stop_codon:yes gene_type:complete
MILKIIFITLLYFLLKNLFKGYVFFSKIQKEHEKSFQNQRNQHDNNSTVIEAEYKVVD